MMGKIKKRLDNLLVLGSLALAAVVGTYNPRVEREYFELSTSGGSQLIQTDNGLEFKLERGRAVTLCQERWTHRTLGLDIVDTRKNYIGITRIEPLGNGRISYSTKQDDMIEL